MSYFSKPSMIPGAGTALNMRWLLPTASGATPQMTRALGNSKGGDPGTIYDQLQFTKAVNNATNMTDGESDVSQSSKFSPANTLSLLSSPKKFMNSVSGLKFVAAQPRQAPTGDNFARMLGTAPDSPINTIRAGARMKYGDKADAIFPEYPTVATPLPQNQQMQDHLATNANYTGVQQDQRRKYGAAVSYLNSLGISDPNAINYYISAATKGAGS